MSDDQNLRFTKPFPQVPTRNSKGYLLLSNKLFFQFRTRTSEKMRKIYLEEKRTKKGDLITCSGISFVLFGGMERKTRKSL